MKKDRINQLKYMIWRQFAIVIMMTSLVCAIEFEIIHNIADNDYSKSDLTISIYKDSVERVDDSYIVIGRYIDTKNHILMSLHGDNITDIFNSLMHEYGHHMYDDLISVEEKTVWVNGFCQREQVNNEWYYSDRIICGEHFAQTFSEFILYTKSNNNITMKDKVKEFNYMSKIYNKHME